MADPIYIVGNNPLAHYLGYQLQSAGHEVIILLDRTLTSTPPNAIEFSIKDDRKLSNHHCHLNAELSMQKNAGMVIITSFPNRFNTAIAALSPLKIKNAPIICFTPFKDMSYLLPIISDNLYSAFFDGYIISRKNSISLEGRTPEISIYSHGQTEISPEILETFGSSAIRITPSENRLYDFWNYIIPYTICSIWSAAENNKISVLLKDKNNTQFLHSLVDEFCSMAASDGIKPDKSAIMKKIYGTPANYTYPLHRSILNGGKDDFDFLTSVITQTAISQEINIPQTYKLLKKLYNSALS